VTAAKRFSITYHKFYKVVTVFDPETTLAPGVNYEQYILYLCGAQVPTAADLEAAKTAGLEAVKAEIPSYAGSLTQKTFEIPISAAAATETVSLSFMTTAFNGREGVKYFSDYVVDACFQQALTRFEEKGECTHEGLSPMYNPYATTDEDKALAKSQVDKAEVVFGSSFDNADAKSVAFFATADPGNLNRAEWSKMIAAFFNHEDEADEHFDSISTEYRMHEAAAAAAVPAASRKKVAWVVDETWSSSFKVELDAYKTETITDAAGVAPTKADLPQATSTGADAAYSYEVAATASDADRAAAKKSAAAKLFADLRAWGAAAVLDETYAVDPTAYDLAAFRETFCVSVASSCAMDAGADRTFAEGLKVLRTDRTISGRSLSLDWFESAIAHPNRVIQDLMLYTAPTAVAPGYQSAYLRDVSAGQAINVVEAGQCTAELEQCKPEEPAVAVTPSAAAAPALSAALLAAGLLAALF